MLMIIIIFSIPFCVSGIYNFFYGRHINKQMNENKRKSWISPVSVFFITLLLEFLIVLILFQLYSVKNTFKENNYENLDENLREYSIYTETQIDKSIYSIFNGNEVNGYTKRIGQYGNFNYILYTCDYTINTYPKYVLITDYIGGKEYISEETIVLMTSATKNNSWQDTEWGGIEENKENSNRIYFIIEPEKNQIISIKMYLFDEKQNNRFLSNEEYSDLKSQEKEMKKSAVEEFSITL